jgi:hypothetical protein
VSMRYRLMRLVGGVTRDKGNIVSSILLSDSELTIEIFSSGDEYIFLYSSSYTLVPIFYCIFIQ